MGNPQVSYTDALRLELSSQIPLKRKSALGQFMTPATIARFMASLFPETTEPSCRLLDAGAGVGALTSAFLDRWEDADGFNFISVDVQTYEIDDLLRAHLEKTLARYANRLPVKFNVCSGDFIWEAACRSFDGSAGFTHAILNPPYKKISSSSDHREILRRAGIETVNLYSAFVALAITLLEPCGQLVAIIPRSFCNGPYYRPFRDFMLRHAALQHIHLFSSRSETFKDDDVLQETVIVRFKRDCEQGNVTVSSSTDDSFSDLLIHEHPFERIVFPDDDERFIHVPASKDVNPIESSSVICYSLSEIGVDVSTGPVVDFRLEEHMRHSPDDGTVPLLYPANFIANKIYWPREEPKRGNAIAMNSSTMKWLYPNSFYTVVRRFSAKEERRRIIASTVYPNAFPNATMLGFENHLNVFHEGKQGLSEDLAYGLTSFLNTTAVDDYFRRFNGHTQVNATDLRLMRYPTREKLIALGAWTRLQTDLTQEILDNQLEKLINGE